MLEDRCGKAVGVRRRERLEGERRESSGVGKMGSDSELELSFEKGVVNKEREN